MTRSLYARTASLFAFAGRPFARLLHLAQYSGTLRHGLFLLVSSFVLFCTPRRSASCINACARGQRFMPVSDFAGAVPTLGRAPCALAARGFLSSMHPPSFSHLPFNCESFVADTVLFRSIVCNSLFSLSNLYATCRFSAFLLRLTFWRFARLLRVRATSRYCACGNFLMRSARAVSTMLPVEPVAAVILLFLHVFNGKKLCLLVDRIL